MQYRFFGVVINEYYAPSFIRQVSDSHVGHVLTLVQVCGHFTIMETWLSFLEMVIK